MTAQPPQTIRLIVGTSGIRIWTADDSLRHKYPGETVFEYALTGKQEPLPVPAGSAWQPL